MRIEDWALSIAPTIWLRHGLAGEKQAVIFCCKRLPSIELAVEHQGGNRDGGGSRLFPIAF